MTAAAALLAGPACTSDAQTIDLVGHNGFEQCWSHALTQDAFLQLLATATEGTQVCIPPAEDGSSCATSMCTDGSPGCSVTLRAGQYSTGQVLPNDGYVQFYASNGFDPFSMPVVLPIVGACTVNFVDTTNVVIQYPLYEYLLPDGNNGWYAYAMAAGSATVTGLTADKVSLSGSIGCQVANLGLAFFTDLLSGQLAATVPQALAPATVGESLCPLP